MSTCWAPSIPQLVVDPTSLKREGLISGLPCVFEGVTDGKGEGGGGMSRGHLG